MMTMHPLGKQHLQLHPPMPKRWQDKEPCIWLEFFYFFCVSTALGRQLGEPSSERSVRSDVAVSLWVVRFWAAPKNELVIERIEILSSGFGDVGWM